ncbi:MAG: twin-arginine translocation signal domain-containing protein, partial [Acidimicrobiia bacterium]|nr:twin-arginine translocation signal domain-containing protein [Acidimicrobiia bacterium]
MSRRRFLARSGAGLGAALLAPSLLSSCAQTSDQFTFSNWVAYIDEDDNGNAR